MKSPKEKTRLSSNSLLEQIISSITNKEFLMKSPRYIVFLLTVLTCSFALAHTWTAKSGHKLEGEFGKEL